MLTVILPTNLEPSGQCHPSSSKSERLLNSYDFHEHWWLPQTTYTIDDSFSGGMH